MNAPTTAIAIPATLSLTALPVPNAELLDGVFGGVTTHEGRHCAVIRIAFQEDNDNFDHDGAKAWAAGLGEGIVLTPPHVFQLMVETLPKLPGGLYHTSKLYSSSDAWYCHSDGGQDDDDRSALGGAVAVRLIPLTL